MFFAECMQLSAEQIASITHGSADEFVEAQPLDVYMPRGSRHFGGVRRFMLLMHGDTIGPGRSADWGIYLDALRTSGAFEGGSSIAAGSGHRKTGTAAPTADTITGYLLLTVDSLDHAKTYLDGNPVYEAGGTVEIREVIED